MTTRNRGPQVIALLMLVRIAVGVLATALGWLVLAGGSVLTLDVGTDWLLSQDAWLPWLLAVSVDGFPWIVVVSCVLALVVLAGSFALFFRKRYSHSVAVSLVAAAILAIPLVDVGLSFGLVWVSQAVCNGDLACF